jgi:hypothetical protein
MLGSGFRHRRACACADEHVCAHVHGQESAGGRGREGGREGREGGIGVARGGNGRAA